MAKIEFESWNEGFEKVEFTKYLASKCGIRLLKAKEIADDILEGKVTYLECKEDNAELIVKQARSFGINCRKL